MLREVLQHFFAARAALMRIISRRDLRILVPSTGLEGAADAKRRKTRKVHKFPIRLIKGERKTII
jgi:hypothetical protein